MSCPSGGGAVRGVVVAFVTFFMLELLSLSCSVHGRGHLLGDKTMRCNGIGSLLLALTRVICCFSTLCRTCASKAAFGCFSIYNIFVVNFTCTVLFCIVCGLRSM